MAQIKTRGIVALTAAADQTGNEGYCVVLGATGVTVATGAADKVIGVITEGDVSGGKSDVAVFGAIDGTAHFKAGGAVTAGSRLMLKADGTVDCAATGLCVGVALDAAATGELFEGAPLTPVTYT